MIQKCTIFFLVIFNFFLVSNVVAQDLNVEQTLNYLNKQLNEKNNKFSIASYSRENLGDLLDDYSTTIKLEKGRLVIMRTFTKGYIYYPNQSSSYTEKKYYTFALEEISIPINAIDANFNYNSGELDKCYKVPAQLYIAQKEFAKSEIINSTTFYNKDGSENRKKTNWNAFYIVEFSNADLICNKLRNAFSHLINLVHDDEKYNKNNEVDNDPFLKPSITKNINPQGNQSIPSTQTNSIAMIKVGGVYEIPMIINDVLKLNFIFDAGAADVSISADVALTLIRTGTLSEKDFIGTQSYRFADGSTAKSKTFLIKKIQIGNKFVYNIKASISNSVDAPLLLGQSVLNKFGKVTIDYKNNVIIFD